MQYLYWISDLYDLPTFLLLLLFFLQADFIKGGSIVATGVVTVGFVVRVCVCVCVCTCVCACACACV